MDETAISSETETTPKRRGRPKGSTNVKQKGKRGAGRPPGTTRGSASTLLRSLIKQNGFSGTGTITITEGRKTVSLPLGLFTGK